MGHASKNTEIVDSKTAFVKEYEMTTLREKLAQGLHAHDCHNKPISKKWICCCNKEYWLALADIAIKIISKDD